jgi:GNAT superfamily N-acetyltransferase
MDVEVLLAEDPAQILREARPYLAREPVRSNLILTVLSARIARPEPGRYWLARLKNNVVGLVFQSPLNYRAVLSPMTLDVAAKMADAVAFSPFAIPGCMGEAAVAARFAGQWSEHTKLGAVPIEGQRLCEADRVAKKPTASGELREAGPKDRELLIGWMRGFMSDVGDALGDPERAVDARLGSGLFWIWEDGRPVCMSGHTESIEGVVRVGPVYTPPEYCNRGYAGACVAELTDRILNAGHRPILYTALGNPTSNSIYRRIGYEAVAEVINYRFASASSKPRPADQPRP